MSFRAVLAVLIGILALAAGAAHAGERYALLIGVSEYDNEKIRDLNGPRNDVAMMWRLLKARNFDPENIEVLSDSVYEGDQYPKPAALPTHAAIITALGNLAGKVKPDDFVVIYFSGHGTDQPDNPAATEPEQEPEAYNVDQVLLPRDAGQADPTTRMIANGLVDDELGKYIRDIRTSGAFVWAIIDACQSATATRGIGDVIKSVKPEDLGIRGMTVLTDPDDRHREGQLSPKVKWGGGGFAGFYASDLKSEAIERSFPGYDAMIPQNMRSREGAENMGAFTFHLHRALTLRKPSTLRELMRDLIADIRSGAAGGSVPPPVFDGDLDQKIFVGGETESFVQAKAENGKIAINGGKLQGFDKGAVLDLYAANDQTLDPFAQATVVSADYEKSSAEAPAEAKVVDGPVWVAINRVALGFDFRVARPPEEQLTDPALKAKVEAVLAAAFAQGSHAWRSGLTLQPADDPHASVFLKVGKDDKSDADRLWLVRRDAEWIKDEKALGATVRFRLGEEPEQTGAGVSKALWTFARADKLVRLASALGAGANENNLTIDARLVPKSQPSNIKCPARDYEQADRDSKVDAPRDDAWPPFDAADPVTARNCDELDVLITNSSLHQFYVGAFYIDALGGVQALEKRGSDCHAPLRAGDRMKVKQFSNGKELRPRLITWKNEAESVGTEHLAIIAIPSEGLSEPPALCKLIQDTPPVSTRGVIKGEGSNAELLNDLLDGVLLDTGTRGPQFEVVALKTSISGKLLTVNLKP